jgi:hypothetical protein
LFTACRRGTCSTPRSASPWPLLHHRRHLRPCRHRSTEADATLSMIGRDVFDAMRSNRRWVALPPTCSGPSNRRSVTGQRARSLDGTRSGTLAVHQHRSEGPRAVGVRPRGAERARWSRPCPQCAAHSRCAGAAMPPHPRDRSELLSLPVPPDSRAVEPVLPCSVRISGGDPGRSRRRGGRWRGRRLRWGRPRRTGWRPRRGPWRPRSPRRPLGGFPQAGSGAPPALR